MEDARNDNSASSPYNATNTLVPPSADSPSTDPSNKKRRGSPSTSRGVANLTPEQLAKKRANDREAQRAIRERTKSQIEALERRIEQLTAQQPYQDLQRVVRQKEAVEAENEEIKRRLASVLGVLQAIVGGSTPGETTITPYGNGPQSTDSASDTPLHNGDSLPPVPSPFPEGRPRTANSSRTMVSNHNYWHTPPIPPHATPSPHTPSFISVNPLDRQQRDSLAPTPDLSNAGEKLGLNYLLDDQRHPQDPRPHPHDTRPQPPPPLPTNSHITLQPRHPPPHPHLPSPTPRAFSTPIKNTPPTCPLDGLLLNFLATLQHQLHTGIPSTSLTGPSYPSFSTLLNPAHPSHRLSKVFTDMLHAFPDLSGLAEKVAVLLVMFLVTRWQIAPTRENYQRLPHWMTPRASQVLTPHPAWVDHLPWPTMRDRLVDEYADYPFEDFFVSFTKTLSLNWPAGEKGILEREEGTAEWRISVGFEAHLRDLGNWSLGRAFERAMPGLGGTARIVGRE